MFQPVQVWFALSKRNMNSAIFPAKLTKTFAAYLAEPLADIINTSVRWGEHPNIHKFEVSTSTPVPKAYPTQSIEQRRNISGSFKSNFAKTFQKLLVVIMMSYMS